jgi:hypothetical protein
MKNTKLTDDSLFEYCRKTDEIERQYAVIAPRLTWAMLEALEPALGDLLYAAHHADTGADSFCGQFIWLGRLKPQMIKLVGHGRPDFHPILGTDAAYDLAYDKLQWSLPPCRNCRNCGCGE